MSEQAPRPEKAGNEMVPAYIFDKAWQEGNFLIPTNDEIREELRKQLEKYSHYGIMWMPENEKARAVLEARIEAIGAYDAKIPKTKTEVSGNKMESRRERSIALVKELSEDHEFFPFHGLDPEAYANLKNGEEKDPGYATPIDGLVERFRNEGMKVVLGKHPKSGNVYILPAQSNDIENDSIFPRHLQLSEVTGEKLKELILLQKQMSSFAIRN